ncbi:alpha/beta hydrolase [Proteiniclasticum sp. BAD-10]|uniref:Alpha/beta hydrolase n=1 Tax=Proteiniclasticum sediminis TaxID=2804028 RepID=A0A941HR39_9CLOT|nr:alpha/beta hydrolase [Proteiniclasticum sediminis]MBR0577169.1 alpha/beta hydrolase [Proteiniclasticum sediminis]
MKTSVFKSEEAKNRLRTAYNQILRAFPFEQHLLETAFGETFLLAAGDEAHLPIVLLHGSCSNSAFWFPEIMALSRTHRVYAVDLPGEAGNSTEYRPDLESPAFSLWLQEVLDRLHLEKTALTGNSLGGWMALKFATAFPQRVSSLTLLASAGLAPIREQFFHQVDQQLSASGTVTANSQILGAAQIPKEVLDFMNLIIASYTPIPSLPLFSEDELRHLTMPVLFIDGTEDPIIDGEASAQRLTQLLPQVTICLKPKTGHVIPDAMKEILPFLQRHS